jgi:hypothetical protein
MQQQRPTTDENNGKQPAVSITASSSSSSSSSSLSPFSFSNECETCVSYLIRAFDRVGSRQQSLLRALGVVSHRASDTGEERMYKRLRDGSGILVQLKSKEWVTSTSSPFPSSVPGEKNTHHSKEDQAGADGDAATVRQQKQGIETENFGTKSTTTSTPTITLRNRLTKLVEGIQNSADDMIQQQQYNDSVISTSPKDQHNLLRGDEEENKQESRTFLTTIAIECQSCGSDTRAEAGARAYVKGPEPLSIVLCSNRLSSQREIDEVLLHELMHIYDIKERKMDLTQCNQLAYSEVRAAREAECGNSLTAFTAKICAKDKATVATKNMFPDMARKCVCDVFEEAMNDYSPFDHPSLNRWNNSNRASDR